MTATIRRVTISFSSIALVMLAFTGIYNTIIIKNDSFMAYDSGVKFVKRLDEINGKVTFGRMAASATSWTKLAPKKKVIAKPVQKTIAKKQVERKEEFTKVEPVNVPEPAIKGDLDLTVSNVFFKKPLKEGSFSGSAKTVDGVIEEIYVNLPGVEPIEINTRDRMVGNVFQYEDRETREMRSGMFYEVKPGTYMITLTGDKNYKYSGVRIEFSSDSASEVAYSDEYYESTQSWGMDNQAADDQEYSNNQAQDNYDYQYNNEESQATGFNFNPKS